MRSNEILEIGRALSTAGHIVAGDGNISCRVTEDLFEITCSGVNKGRITLEDLVLIQTWSGAVAAGARPSSELALHREVYLRCPGAKFVAHAHPKAATAWSLTGLSHLPDKLLPEVILAAGKIPIAPYARPGTQAMAEVIRPYLPGCRIIILARHGALVWGETSEEVVWGMDRLEQVCSVLLMARQLGLPISELPAEEIEALTTLREKLGPTIL
jgi:L-fuculose-phosphate aldolase